MRGFVVVVFVSKINKNATTSCFINFCDRIELVWRVKLWLFLKAARE